MLRPCRIFDILFIFEQNIQIAKRKTPEQRLLLDQLQQVAQGLGETFAPFCEVVVHDLLDPKHAVLAIHNPLSGRGFQTAMTQFVQVDAPHESLDPSGADRIRERIDQFAARLASTPRALKAQDRRALMAELKAAGLLDLRRAMDTVAAHLGVSRASVYSYAK